MSRSSLDLGPWKHLITEHIPKHGPSLSPWTWGLFHFTSSSIASQHCQRKKESTHPISSIHIFFSLCEFFWHLFGTGAERKFKKKSFPFPIQISLWRINLSRRYQKGEQRDMKMHHVRARQQLRIPVLWRNGCDSDAPPCGSPAPLCFTWFVSCWCVKLAPKAGLWVI